MIPVTVPALGESITEAIVARWLKRVGEAVAADEPLVELETDKITVEVPAPSAGVLARQAAATEAVVTVGDVIGEIDEGAVAVSAAPATTQVAPSAAPAAAPLAMPAAVAEAHRAGVDLAVVEGTGRAGRILKEDVQRAAEAPAPVPAPTPAAIPAATPAPAPVPAAPAGPAPAAAAGEERVKMSSLRKRVAERLVKAQQTAAILTTFNEVDMSAVMAVRAELKQAFADRHGVKLGFMSFFVKAAVGALRAFPAVNAEIDGDDIVYKHHFDIGVAVGGGRGLVVPVVRGCDARSFAGVEGEIARLAELARTNKLQIADLTGGTFTISNGGVYGSMLSTPILNPPQTGILGLHNIVERPVAVAGKIEIRPVMYLALSYDHRLVDGREAVQFLVHVKDAIEDPRRLLLEI
jgi:2-oxoglutarate dehydrogenase E2 component (dihydrolipoamide succinyltransferase)